MPVGHEELWMIERCSLVADPVIRERNQEFLQRLLVHVLQVDEHDVPVQVVNVHVAEVALAVVELEDLL